MKRSHYKKLTPWANRQHHTHPQHRYVLLHDVVTEPPPAAPDFVKGAEFYLHTLADEVHHNYYPDGTRFANGKDVYVVKKGTLVKV